AFEYSASSPAAWWPATSLAPGEPIPPPVLRLSLAAGERASLQRRPVEPWDDLAVGARGPQTTSKAITLEVHSARPLATVAWRLAEDRTDVGSSVQHVPWVDGVSRVQAWVAADDGQIAVVERSLH